MGFCTKNLWLMMILIPACCRITGASSMEWVQIGDPLTPRDSTGICYYPVTDSVILFGDHAEINDAWEWNGFKWNRLLPETAPGFQIDYKIVFSTSRNALLI